MNHREFFYLVSNMRQAQRDYFQCRTPERLRACKWLEGQVDREIMRVKEIVQDKDNQAQ